MLSPSPDARRNADTLFAVAVGTGATFSGLVSALKPWQRAVGFPVVNDASVPARIRYWIETHSIGSNPKYWSIRPHRQLSPYGKVSDRLLEFILRFFHDTGIALDPVYTGKAFHALLEEEFLDSLTEGTQLVFVHTGGLIGAYGYRDRFSACAEPSLIENYFNEVGRLTGSG